MYGMMKAKAALLIFCTGLFVGLMCGFLCGRKVYEGKTQEKPQPIATRNVEVQSQTTYRKASVYKADQFSRESFAVSRCVVLGENDHGAWSCN